MSAPAFSYAVPVGDISDQGRSYRIEADAVQRTALAQDLGIPAVESLAADLTLRPVRGSAFNVRGTLRARVVQTCVVSLEPVTQEVVEPVDVLLVQEESENRHQKEVFVDALEADGPEVYRNGRIDLGVIVAEHLALGLDPYPRAPQTDFGGHVEDEPGPEESPFAALGALKPPRN
ncbi:YceD family protein [Propylenella binzhouense]|nr:DUF177 domain-containing protein [Propylenella binzhouense]